MLKTGEFYTCLTDKVSGFYYGETAELKSIDIYWDTVKLKKLKDLSEHTLLMSLFEQYFVQFGNEYQPSLDEMIGKGLSTSCECGCVKVYGPNCPSEYHSDFCPLYLK